MGEWTVDSVEKLCKIGRGRVISQFELKQDGDYPVYSSQTTKNGEMGRINTFDFDGEYVTWTTDGANAGTVFYRNGKFNCTNVCGTLKSKEKITERFLARQLGYIAKKYVSYIGNPKLMNNVVAKINISYPINKGEQEKIAEILTTIDDAIEKTTQIIEKYKAIKEGMMQDLLSNGIDEKGNIRSPKTHKYKNSSLGMIPEEWEVLRIEDLFKLRARIGWQGLRSDEFQEEGPYLVTGVDFDDGEIDWDSCYHVSEMRFHQDKGIQLKDGDLLITKDGTIGKTAIVNNCPKDVTLNSGVFVVRPINKLATTEYLYYLLNNRSFELFMANNLTGSTIKHLNQGILYKMDIRIPKREEQERICVVLKSIDQKLKKEKIQIEKYIKIKQALMQDLLTHKVAVDILL